MSGKGLKIVVVGDAGVGKTSILRKLLGYDIPRRYTPTLGVDVYPYKVGDKDIYFWDTAGKESFAGAREAYYLEADVCIAVYLDAASKKNVAAWVKRVHDMSPKVRVCILSAKILNAADSRTKIADIISTLV